MEKGVISAYHSPWTEMTRTGFNLCEARGFLLLLPLDNLCCILRSFLVRPTITRVQSERCRRTDKATFLLNISNSLGIAEKIAAGYKR